MAVSARMAASMARQGLSSGSSSSGSSGSQQLPQNVSDSIQSQINAIQTGINSLRGGGGTGGAVNASGQLVDSSGKVIGTANRADRYSPSAVQAEATPEPQALDTKQPSPKTVTATPFTKPQIPADLPYEQASKNLASGGLVGNDLVMAQDALKKRYQQGLQEVSQTGVPAPSSAGAGAAGVTAALGTQPNNEEPQSIVGGIMETDSSFDSILTDYDKFMAPQEQRKSLLQEYQAMSDALGISGMNAELLNSKRIIEGTEDDIRAEVVSTGGMATESQVLALANARNKSLIKNYNYLLEARDSAQTQLSTMMNLSIKDREMANAEFDRKMNFAFKVQEFKQKAIDNAKSNYQNIVNKVGYAGLLQATNGNAYEQSLIEKTLGLGTGGLAKLATIVNPDEELDRELKRAQIANQYSQISERSLPKAPKAPTQDQLKVAGYKDRLIESDATIQKLGSQFTGLGSYIGSSGLVPNALKSSERQQFEQAQRNFINSVLRRESGASISEQEFDNARKQYFPQPGDTPGTLAQKAQNRRTIINSFARESSNVTSNIVVAPDGKEIEIID